MVAERATDIRKKAIGFDVYNNEETGDKMSCLRTGGSTTNGPIVFEGNGTRPSHRGGDSRKAR